MWILLHSGDSVGAPATKGSNVAPLHSLVKGFGDSLGESRRCGKEENDAFEHYYRL
jgi:hypothetical protein